MDAQCRKAYVSVNMDVDKEGVCHPRFIRWDNGLIFQIDQILYKCRASSKKVGGGGIRYTVMIKGREQMCEILSISTKTGYRILREGKICCLKVGRAYRIPKAHLFTYLCIGCGEVVTA